MPRPTLLPRQGHGGYLDIPDADAHGKDRVQLCGSGFAIWQCIHAVSRFENACPATICWGLSPSSSKSILPRHVPEYRSKWRCDASPACAGQSSDQPRHLHATTRESKATSPIPDRSARRWPHTPSTNQNPRRLPTTAWLGLQVVEDRPHGATRGTPDDGFLNLVAHEAPPIAIGQPYAAKTVQLCATADPVCFPGGLRRAARSSCKDNGMAIQAADFVVRHLGVNRSFLSRRVQSWV